MEASTLSAGLQTVIRTFNSEKNADTIESNILKVLCCIHIAETCQDVKIVEHCVHTLQNASMNKKDMGIIVRVWSKLKNPSGHGNRIVEKAVRVFCKHVRNHGHVVTMTVKYNIAATRQSIGLTLSGCVIQTWKEQNRGQWLQSLAGLASDIQWRWLQHNAYLAEVKQQIALSIVGDNNRISRATTVSILWCMVMSEHCHTFEDIKKIGILVANCFPSGINNLEESMLWVHTVCNEKILHACAIDESFKTVHAYLNSEQKELPQGLVYSSEAGGIVEFVVNCCVQILQITGQDSWTSLLYADTILQRWTEIGTAREPGDCGESTGTEGSGDLEKNGREENDNGGSRKDENSARKVYGRKRKREENGLECGKTWEKACKKFREATTPIISFCSCCHSIKRQENVVDWNHASKSSQWIPHEGDTFKICKGCVKNLKNPQWKPKIAPMNPIPPEVQVLSRLESAILASVIAFQHIVTLPTTMQKGLKGHVVSVPSNASKVQCALPNDYRPFIIYRGKLLRKLCHKHAYKSGYIRPDIVKAAITRIIHTPVYTGFQFDEQKLESLADDFPFNDMSDTDEKGENGQHAEEENRDKPELVDHGNIDIEMEDNNGWTTETDIREVMGTARDNETCLFEGTVNELLDSIDTNMRRKSLVAQKNVDIQQELESSYNVPCTRVLQNEEVRLAPGEGNKPIPCWQDDDLKPKMFLKLYGGYFQENPNNLSKHELDQYLLRHVDRRFGQHVEAIFQMLREQQTSTVFQASCMSLQKGVVKTKEITVANALDPKFIKAAILQENGTLHLQQLRTSPDYLKAMKRDFLAFLKTLGTPTFFFTVSCADTRWLPLLQTLYWQKNREELTEEAANRLSYRDRCELVASDPVLVAMYYYSKVQAFFAHIIDGTKILGDIQDRAHVEEAQKRGTPHRHSLLYAAQNPGFNRDDPSHDAACERFIDDHITTDLDLLPEDMRGLQTHACARGKCLRRSGECRFHAPWYPMPATRILRKVELQGEAALHAAKNLDQINKMIHKLDIILRKTGGLTPQEAALKTVNFEEFLACCEVTDSEYFQAIAHGLKRSAVVFYKRSPQYLRVNPFNATLSMQWGAHIDLQYVLDEYACVQYLTSYMVKGDRRLGQAMYDIMKRAEQDLTLAAAIRQAGLTFMYMSEVSAQMAAFLLLGYPVRYLSRAVLYIDSNNPDNRRIILKRNKTLKDLDPLSTDVFAVSIHQHFRDFVQYSRMHDKPDLCLVDFAVRYGPLTRVKASRKVSVIDTAIGEGNTSAIDTDSESHEHEQETDSETEEEDRVHVHEGACNDGKFPKRIFQSAKQIRKLRQHPSVPRFSVLPAPVTEEEEYRSLILLFAPGSAWATKPECQENVALLGGYATYAEHYAALRTTIEENAAPYHMKSNAEWDALVQEAQERCDSDDDAHSALSMDSDTRQLMMIANSPMLPLQPLPMQQPNEACTTTARVVLWNTNELHNEAASLTGEQRLVVQYAVNHVFLHAWGLVEDPLMLLVTGGAGTGKSCVLRFLRQVFERIIPHNLNTEGDGIRVQVAAQNGKAAWLAKGQTLHSALGWKPGQEGNIPQAKKQELIAKYQHLHVFMLDEASQISCDNFAHVHHDLQEYGNHFQAPFGNIHMTVFADFMQLEPVLAKRFFAKCIRALRGLPPHVQLWDLLHVAELTKVMRQDGWMVPALNRMRVGAHTADDIARFKACERPPPPHLPLHVYTNRQVVQHNKRVYSSSSQQAGCFVAEWPTASQPSPPFRGLMTKALDMLQNYTEDMFKNGVLLLLFLKVGMMVEYTMNNKDGDGLVNGADGIVQAFTLTHAARPAVGGVPVYDVVWVKFTDPTVGQQRRARQRAYIPAGNTTVIDASWTPIPRETVMLHGRSSITVLQNPLLPANARTHDRAQGMTLTEVAVDLTMPRRCPGRNGLYYVALSRVKTPEGLYIVPGTFDPDNIKTSDEALKAIEDALQKRPATISHPPPASTHHLTVVSNNASSLRAHASVAASWLRMAESQTDPSSADVIFVCETNCAMADMLVDVGLQFQDFVIVQYANHNVANPRHKAGSIAMVHERRVANICNAQCIVRDGVEIIYVDITTGAHSLRLIHVYRSPSIGRLSTVLDSLEPVLHHPCWILTGDMNVNALGTPQDPQFSTMLDFFGQHHAVMLLARPTTVMGSLLDHIWTNAPTEVQHNGCLWVPYSDHFLTWATVKTPT